MGLLGTPLQLSRERRRLQNVLWGMWGVREFQPCSRPRSCLWAGIFASDTFFYVLSSVRRWHFGTKCRWQNSGALSLILLAVVLHENVKIIVPQSSWKYFSDVLCRVDGHLFWNLVNLVLKVLIHCHSLKSFPFKEKEFVRIERLGHTSGPVKDAESSEFFWRTWRVCKIYLNITRDIKDLKKGRLRYYRAYEKYKRW